MLGGGVGIVLAKKGSKIIVVLVKNFRQGLGVNEFEEALIRSGRKHLVGGELQVQIFFSEEALHQLEELNHELILSNVIPVLEKDRVILVVGCLEGQEEGLLRTLEDIGGFGHNSGDSNLWVKQKRD